MTPSASRSQDYLDCLMTDQRTYSSPSDKTLRGAQALASKELKRLQGEISRNARQARLSQRTFSELSSSDELQSSTHERARLIRETLVPKFQKLDTCLASIERKLADLPAAVQREPQPQVVQAGPADEVAAPVVADEVAAPVAANVAPAHDVSAPQVPAPAARLTVKQRIGKALADLWASLKSFAALLASAFTWIFNRRRA